MTIQKVDLHPELNDTFSSYTTAGDTIYTSHVAGWNPETGRWPATIEAQTEQCFRRLAETLAHAGAALDDVAKIMGYLRNPDDFPGMKAVYRRQFAHGYPARSTVFTPMLDDNCLLQIDAVAYRPA